MGGTLAYMAPEIVSGTCEARRPAPSADVFSFGRLTYMVMTRRRPLQGMDKTAALSGLRKGLVPALAWPTDLPTALVAQALVSQCCHVDAHRKPSMQTIRKGLLAWPLTSMLDRGGSTNTEIRVRNTLSSAGKSESDLDFAIAIEEARTERSRRMAARSCPPLPKGTPCTSTRSALSTVLV